MSKFKRTNKSQSSMDTILVGSANSALATGALVNGTTAFNIANGQLGLLSWDHEGTVALGSFVDNGNADVAKVAAVKLVQGTPLSGSTHTVEAWEVQDQGLVSSGIIHRDNIRSVSTSPFRVPNYAAVAAVDFPAFAANKTYKAYGHLYSVRKDRDYSDNDDVVSEVVVTPTSVSDIADLQSWVLQQFAYKLNTRSKVVNTTNSAAMRHGNKEFVVLGINTAGGSGVTIGSISSATPTVIPIMNDYDVLGQAVTTNLTATNTLVKSLAKLVVKQAAQETAGTTITDQITASSTIEVIDLKNAKLGSRASGTITMTNVGNLATDTFTINGTALVEGTDWNRGASTTTAATALAAAINSDVAGVSAKSNGAIVTVYADVYGAAGDAITMTYTDGGTAGATLSGATLANGGDAGTIDALVFLGLDHKKAAYFDNIEQVMVDVDFSLGGDLTASPIYSKVNPDEGTGQGWKAVIDSDDRYQLTVHTAQNQPHGEYFSKGISYLDATKNYTTTIVEYYDYEDVLGLSIQTPKRVKIFLESTATATDVTTAISNLGSGDAIATATVQSTAVTSLNSIFKTWAETARTYTNHQLLGSATSSAYFV